MVVLVFVLDLVRVEVEGRIVEVRALVANCVVAIGSAEVESGADKVKRKQAAKRATRIVLPAIVLSTLLPSTSAAPASKQLHCDAR